MWRRAQRQKVRVRVYQCLRHRFYWPGLWKDVIDHVNECHECTMAKRLPKPHAHPVRPGTGRYPFDVLIADIVHMAPTADGKYDKLIVFADSLTRWVEAVPCKGDPTSEQVLDAFMHEVVSRHGVPREIRTDASAATSPPNCASLSSRRWG